MKSRRSERRESAPILVGLARSIDVGRLRLLALLMAAGIVSLAGCGGDNNSSSPPPPPPPSRALPATNASVFAVDCQTGRGYVPLPFLSNNLTGEVAVLDLGVNPDDRDPRIGIIDLGLIARPRAAAAIPGAGEILVISDPVTANGVLQIIRESDGSIVNVSFPAGSRPSAMDGIVYNPASNTALVSMTDVAQGYSDSCPSAGTCTGTAVFDLASNTFGPLINLGNRSDNLALDSSADTALLTSDPITPNLFAPDLTSAAACELNDQNLAQINADPEGVAADPATHIWVVGNYLSATATVINLNGASYSSGANCMLNEAGTPPNSINQDTGAPEGMPGVAINPVTHEALMTSNGGGAVALLSLPSAPVAQLDAAQITSETGDIPNDPDGLPFSASAAPYAVVTDSCHNSGYILDADGSFLVRVDLAEFKKNSAAISTPLPRGHCAGAHTQFSCSNGRGVTFFPLPGA